MILKNIYSLLFYFFKKRNRNDNFLAWYYTISATGFLLAMNFMSIFHMLYRGVEVEKYKYVGLLVSLWAVSFVYFFLDKKAKEKLLLEREEIPRFTWIIFLLYLVFSKVFFLYINFESRKFDTITRWRHVWGSRLR